MRCATKDFNRLKAAMGKVVTTDVVKVDFADGELILTGYDKQSSTFARLCTDAKATKSDEEWTIFLATNTMSAIRLRGENVALRPNPKGTQVTIRCGNAKHILSCVIDAPEVASIESNLVDVSDSEADVTLPRSAVALASAASALSTGITSTIRTYVAIAKKELSVVSTDGSYRMIHYIRKLDKSCKSEVEFVVDSATFANVASPFIDEVGIIIDSGIATFQAGGNIVQLPCFDEDFSALLQGYEERMEAKTLVSYQAKLNKIQEAVQDATVIISGQDALVELDLLEDDNLSVSTHSDLGEAEVKVLCENTLVRRKSLTKAAVSARYLLEMLGNAAAVCGADAVATFIIVSKKDFTIDVGDSAFAGLLSQTKVSVS